MLAGLRRRGWAGRLVWAFAPVQDRHAAPAVRRALQDLAACEEVEVIIVARGGGSLADLFAFCDETLCRTVALLRTPVISSVGHHTDRTLLDDVAAVACSTPTHAAETAVPIDCASARAALATSAARLERQGRRAVLERARTLARLSRAPGHHVARHRTRLHQQLRELRAATRRAIVEGEKTTGRRAAQLARKSAAAATAADRSTRRALADATTLDRTAAAALERRRRDLERIGATLAAHDPQRTLERGYALIEGPSGEPITSAAAAREQPALTIRLHDGRVGVRAAQGDQPTSRRRTPPRRTSRRRTPPRRTSRRRTPPRRTSRRRTPPRRTSRRRIAARAASRRAARAAAASPAPHPDSPADAVPDGPRLF